MWDMHTKNYPSLISSSNVTGHFVILFAKSDNPPWGEVIDKHTIRTQAPPNQSILFKLNFNLSAVTQFFWHTTCCSYFLKCAHVHTHGRHSCTPWQCPRGVHLTTFTKHNRAEGWVAQKSHRLPHWSERATEVRETEIEYRVPNTFKFF